MTNKSKNFAKILEKHLESGLIPYSKGNTTSIGDYKIIETKKGYVVKPLKSNNTIAVTFSKTAAFAVAKTLNKNTTSIKKILDLDKQIAKDYTDCIYYKHTIEHTSDSMLKDAVRTRFDLSYYKTQKNKKRLESFIL